MKNFVAALGHCAIEEGELGAPVLFLIPAAGLVWLLSMFMQVGYEMVWAPNSTDVTGRLAQLSIIPNRST